MSMKPVIFYKVKNQKGEQIGELSLLGYAWLCRYGSEKYNSKAFLDMDKAKNSFGLCKLERELAKEKTGSFIK
jgi:hypothetical protein